MNKADIENHRKRLLDMREQLTGVLENLAKENLNSSMREDSGDLSGYSLHMADMGTDNFDREFAISITGRENEVLQLIDRALAKIDEGQYGSCEMCEKEITAKRLEAIPYAANCIECESQIEKERS